VFVTRATQNQTRATARFALYAHLFPVPRVPKITHHSKAGFMGVLYPSCTTMIERILDWEKKLPQAVRRQQARI
jgi:hypothetical protein